ncbi:MAG: hypothetical protein Q9197_004464, partial [Variospora fuerteventurae]
MPFLGLSCIIIFFFLSPLHARPGGTACHGHQKDGPSFDPAHPITSSANAPLPNTITAEPAEVSADGRPPHLAFANPSSPPPSGSPQPSLGESGAYPGPQLSYPLYYNSSTIGKTATYGTGVPSGATSDEYFMYTATAGGAGGQSAGCKCPPPSTVTIHDTISAQPFTVTVTSTITSSVEPPPPPQITPALTITITSAVWGARNWQKLGKGDDGPSAAILSSGDDGSARGGMTGPTDPEISPIPASVFVPVVEATAAPNVVSTQEQPETTGPTTAAQSYPRPFTNDTQPLELFFQPETGDYQALGTHGIPTSTIPPMSMSSVPGSQEQPQLSLPDGTNLGQPITSAATTAPFVSSLFNEKPEGQQTSVQDSGQSIILSNGGHGSGNTQVLPEKSSQVPYNSESAVPTSVVSSQLDLESLPIDSSVTPPKTSVNSTSRATAPSARFPMPINPPTSTTPPFANLTTTSEPLDPDSGKGQLHSPSTNVYHSSVLPPLHPVSPAPSQTPMYPIASDLSTSISQSISFAASDSVHPIQIPSSSGAVYPTVTMQVVPVPLATTTNNNSTQGSYGSIYGSGNQKPTMTHPIAEGSTTAPGRSSTILDEGEDEDKEETTMLRLLQATLPLSFEQPSATSSPPTRGTPPSSSPAEPSIPIPTPSPPSAPPSENTTASTTPTCRPSSTLTTAD